MGPLVSLRYRTLRGLLDETNGRHVFAKGPLGGSWIGPLLYNHREVEKETSVEKSLVLTIVLFEGLGVGVGSVSG